VRAHAVVVGGISGQDAAKMRLTEVTEGLDTLDLKEAKALLDELAT